MSDAEKREPVDLEAQKELIRNMTHEEMCRAWRFAGTGDAMFTTPALYSIFHDRFYAFGGMTVEMSKRIGWEKAKVFGPEALKPEYQ